MSTMHDIKTVEFTGRKPSKAMIVKAAKDCIKQGYNAIDISWGENCISLNVNNHHPFNRMGQWFGSGWIKNIGGSDLADELNRTNKTDTAKFMEEHFQLIRIGA